MMDIKLLNYINCPDCQSDVAYINENDEVEKLVCNKCHRIFKIKSGIPQMLEFHYKK